MNQLNEFLGQLVNVPQFQQLEKLFQTYNQIAYIDKRIEHIKQIRTLLKQKYIIDKTIILQNNVVPISKLLVSITEDVATELVNEIQTAERQGEKAEAIIDKYVMLDSMTRLNLLDHLASGQLMFGYVEVPIFLSPEQTPKALFEKPTIDWFVPIVTAIATTLAVL